MFFVWSGDGLDGLAARLHEHLRARPSHPHSPRPVVLNTWEACYFDLAVDRVRALATTAASVGVERFVIDDGWFRGRRDDTAGLGDWYVDEQRFPDGLHPIVDHVRALGMQLGLWVEPEMANLDSDLIREHPSWLLDVAFENDSVEGRSAPEWRGQHVLDVAQPEVSAYLLERLDALVTEYAIDFLKWDHNRDLHAAQHLDRTGTSGVRRVPGVHPQTAAVYALLDELRRRHPGLEIESCSSGGARVDLGVLARTDRVWASDTNDAIERQQIQFWTANLLPPELVGSHVGGPQSHTTDRVLDLPFRLATSLFGHAGIEWDLTSCSAGGAGPDPGLDRALPPTAPVAPLRRRGPRRRDRRGHGAARRRRPGPAGGGLLLRPDRDVAVRGAGPDAPAGPGPGAELPARALPGGQRPRGDRRSARVAGRRWLRIADQWTAADRGRADPAGAASRSGGRPPAGVRLTID